MPEKKLDQQVDNSGASMEQTGQPRVSVNVPEGGLDDRSLDDVSGGSLGGTCTVPPPPPPRI
jgi:hypothetical protein